MSKELKMKPVPDEFNVVLTEAKQLMMFAVNEYGIGSGIADTVAQACNLLRDAGLMTQLHGLSQMACISNEDHWHIIQGGMAAYCGKKMDFSKRMQFDTRVPTCPDCIEKRFGKKRMPSE